MAVTGESWKRTPFEKGVPIPYERVFTAAEFALLQAGLRPKEMEDKWFIYYDEPHLFLHRSWTGMAVYRVAFEESGKGGARVSEALWSTDETNGNVRYEAELLGFLLSRLLLGENASFPVPATGKKLPPGLMQMHIAGTGGPETQE